MSNRYFVVADVHGFADLMKKGLNQAGFNPNNSNHVLISLGDLTDRGPQPIECLEYVLSCPNRILLRGNHEELVDDLIRSREPSSNDVSNGTFATVIEFAKKVRGFNISDTYALMDWDGVRRDAAKLQVWKDYYSELVSYCELGKFVFVHGWIPLVPDWRKNAKDKDWYDAIWAQTPNMVKAQWWDDQHKIIVCGHWHSEYFWRHYNNEPNNFSTFVHPYFIALDACTAYSKQINILVIEDGKVVDNICVN